MLARHIRVESLLESGHLADVRSHLISPNIRYCFVRGKCTPEQRISNDAYDVWAVLHKDNAKVICAECSCIAGYVFINLPQQILTSSCYKKIQNNI